MVIFHSYVNVYQAGYMVWPVTPWLSPPCGTGTGLHRVRESGGLGLGITPEIRKLPHDGLMNDISATNFCCEASTDSEKILSTSHKVWRVLNSTLTDPENFRSDCVTDIWSGWILTTSTLPDHKFVQGINPTIILFEVGELLCSQSSRR